MSRFFDIMPPKPKPAPAAPRRRRNNWGWFLFVAAIIIILILIWPFIKPENTINPNPVPIPTGQTQNNFDLFNSSGQSNLTQNQTLTVRILNTSGKDDAAQKAQKLLTDAGLKIEQIGKGVTPYDQTIIYYKTGQLATGQKVVDILKGAFQTKLQESESLGQTYDVLIIIGQK